MQHWLDIVRSYAPDNLVLVAGAFYSQIIGPAATYPLTGDANVAIVSHIYPGHWYSDSQWWYTNHINTCLTRYPVFMSEWGFTTTTESLLNGSITHYGQPLMDFREARKIGNTAWVASYDWGPPMFYTDWTLRVGEGEMGGFTKDKLYEKRHSDQPGGPGDITPPSVPAGVSATPGFATVLVDWNNNTEGDLAGYNVYRSTTSGGGYSKQNSYFLSNSNYTDVNVFVGTPYYYVVTAIDTNFNESNKSSEVSATPLGSTIVYNFVDINQANTNYNAYACDVDQFPFNGDSTNRNTMVEANDQEYVKISANDTAEWTPVNPGSGDMTFLWIEMKIDESPSKLTRIDLTFNGYTTGGTSPVPHRIYVMKAGTDWKLNTSWVQVGADQGITPGVFTTMTRFIRSNFSTYIDGTGKIIWGVYETTSSQVMHVNYLEMAVSSTNYPPTVSITSPASGATFNYGETVIIEANASDSDGGISKVAFYKGSTKLGEDTTSPYSYDWSGALPDYYVLTAKAYDNNNASKVSSPVNISVMGGLGAGAILREWWMGISGPLVENLTSDVNYPDHPSGRGLIASLEGPTDWGDNYGTRIRGYLYPVVDGNYTFWIASDATSELWLSTSEDPCGASLIAYVPDYQITLPRQWDKFPEQQSSPISLVGGGKYYIEALHKEFINTDNIAVAWQGPGMSQRVIDGMYLSPCCLDLGIFADFAAEWGRTGCAVGNGWCSGADFNRDGVVLFEDLKAFVESWLVGIE
jgi:hypothetical protein